MGNSRLTAALAQTPLPRPAKPAMQRESFAAGVKLSFSLFTADTDRIAAIRAALEGRGHKISASQAVRLALRSAELNGERLAALLDMMQGEDGRTRRHAKRDESEKRAGIGQKRSGKRPKAAG